MAQAEGSVNKRLDAVRRRGGWRVFPWLFQNTLKALLILLRCSVFLCSAIMAKRGKEFIIKSNSLYIWVTCCVVAFKSLFLIKTKTDSFLLHCIICLFWHVSSSFGGSLCTVLSF